MRILVLLMFGFLVLANKVNADDDICKKSSQDAAGLDSSSQTQWCACDGNSHYKICNDSGNGGADACNKAYDKYKDDLGSSKTDDKVSSLAQKIAETQQKLSNIKPDLDKAINGINQKISDLKRETTGKIAKDLDDIADANTKIEDDVNNMKDAIAAYNQGVTDCKQQTRAFAEQYMLYLQTEAHARANGKSLFAPGGINSAFSGPSDRQKVYDALVSGTGTSFPDSQGKMQTFDSYPMCLKKKKDVEESAVRKFNADKRNLDNKIQTLSADMEADKEHANETLQTLLNDEEIVREKAIADEQALSAQLMSLQAQQAQAQQRGVATLDTDIGATCGACERPAKKYKLRGGGTFDDKGYINPSPAIMSLCNDAASGGGGLGGAGH